MSTVLVYCSLCGVRLRKNHTCGLKNLKSEIVQLKVSSGKGEGGVN